jgi:hypothetical protein
VTRGRRLGLAIALLFAPCCSCYSCYMAAFHAWLTATPLSPDQLMAHQRYFYCWLVATVLACLVGVGALVWRRRPRDTSDQPQDEDKP